MEPLEELRGELEKDEGPDYAAVARRLGPRSLSPLEALVRKGGRRTAPQATYLAGLIGGPDSFDLVSLAAENEDPIVRAAAAFTLTELSEQQAAGIAEKLLDDEDSGVRARAIVFAVQSGHEQLLVRVREIAQDDREPAALRELATRLLAEGGDRQR